MLVRRVIIHDQMDIEPFRYTVVEMAQKGQKLLMPMAGLALTDDLTTDDI